MNDRVVEAINTHGFYIHFVDNKNDVLTLDECRNVSLKIPVIIDTNSMFHVVFENYMMALNTNTILNYDERNKRFLVDAILYYKPYSKDTEKGVGIDIKNKQYIIFIKFGDEYIYYVYKYGIDNLDIPRRKNKNTQNSIRYKNVCLKKSVYFGSKTSMNIGYQWFVTLATRNVYQHRKLLKHVIPILEFEDI